jgi:hypothetical protein
VGYTFLALLALKAFSLHARNAYDISKVIGGVRIKIKN